MKIEDLTKTLETIKALDDTYGLPDIDDIKALLAQAGEALTAIEKSVIKPILSGMGLTDGTLVVEDENTVKYPAEYFIFDSTKVKIDDHTLVYQRYDGPDQPEIDKLKIATKDDIRLSLERAKEFVLLSRIPDGPELDTAVAEFTERNDSDEYYSWTPYDLNRHGQVKDVPELRENGRRMEEYIKTLEAFLAS